MAIIKSIIYHIIVALALTGVLTGCRDDYFAFEGDTSAGEADVTIDLAFSGFGDAAPSASRAAAGDAIQDVTEVCVLAYDVSGTLSARKHAVKGEGLEINNDKGTVTVTLGYGRYRIYTVANMGDLSQYGTDIDTEEGLRGLRFGWNDDVAANNQMCGFVTAGSDDPVSNRRPPVVSIDRNTAPLHAWMRRAVSKVTVAYDATELNENVFIYILSAQVRDIPRSCTLVAENVPQVPGGGGENLTAAQALTQGETISYLEKGGDHTSSRVVLAKGSAYGGLQNEDRLNPGENVHLDDEESLFFYENMQGDHPDKHQYGNLTSKDNVPYGTYLEVKAYYVNKGNNPSRGEITYRYMLGLDDTKSFDAPRNTHFRVTLRFAGDANNPDWHIDYNLPGPPAIEIPSPLYISYLYNQQLDIPLTAYYDRSQYEVVSLDARITSNPYTFAGHKYGYGPAGTVNISGTNFKFDYSGPEYGFLSFGKRTETSIVATDKANYTESVKYTSFAGASHDGSKLSWNFPIYTRPLNLLVKRSNGAVVPHGFSGNNHFTHQERVGTVKVTVVFRSLVNGTAKTVEQDVEIRQAKRVVNPKGCWRPHDSAAPFTFTLMESDTDACDIDPGATTDARYTPIRSMGPWSARIYSYSYGGAAMQPGSDWIEISAKDTNAWRSGKDAVVTGTTNSVVEFDYRPKGTIGATATRFGVIEVTYHNHNCHHLIFVSQGYGTVQMGASGKRWMMGNLYANGTEVANPVMEGSMFKYGNADQALLSTNNYLPGNPSGAVAGPYKEAYDTELEWVRKTYDSATGKYSQSTVKGKFGPVAADVDNGFTSAGLSHSATGSGTYRVATYEDYNELLDPDRFGTLFGVLYGAEMSSTATSGVDRYTAAGDKSGMRGCFVFDRGTGNHLFLPVGNTGFGRRKIFYNNNTQYAVLKYANRDAYMDNSLSLFMPMQYDIYSRPGALYWYQKVTNDGGYKYALDINYFSYAVTKMEAQIAYNFGSTSGAFKGKKPTKGDWAAQNSDAAFVRRIRVN